MRIRIFQIDADRDEKCVMFMGLDQLKEFAGSKEVNSEIYNKTFDGEVKCRDLEDVYTKFNVSPPEGYQGHSMSVSDVVEIINQKDGSSEFFYCDNIGFRKIDFESEKVQSLREKEEECL